MRVAIFFIVLIVGVLGTWVQYKKNDNSDQSGTVIWHIAATIVAAIFLSVAASFLYGWFDKLASKFEKSVQTEKIEDESTHIEEIESDEEERDKFVKDEVDRTISVESQPSISVDTEDFTDPTEYVESDIEAISDQQLDNNTGLQSQVVSTDHTYDVSDKVSFSGSIVAKDQKDSYKYVSHIGGTYRFDTDLSSGGSVIVRISDENESSINYGYNALTIDLEAGKTYIISVEYRNGNCDYVVNIGVPVSMTDITNNPYISGSITYQDQKDEYYYTAPVTGTYRFDTDLSSGGSVCVRIKGENGKSINYGYDALTIDLEAGKNYILSVEYRNGKCDYTVRTGVPISITDITDNPIASGSITYRDQKDRYYYTAPVTGTYRFDTDLSSGGSVYVRISGENGKSINYGYDALTIDLEAGKHYILSIEYRNGNCDYMVKTGVPIPITVITGEIPIGGNIAYQDQKDRYYYFASATGTYRFDTNLSSGGSVIVRISGENERSINYGYDALTIDLEAGKTYILSVEFRKDFCTYVLSIGSP